jgi:hypothetical protein
MNGMDHEHPLESCAAVRHLDGMALRFRIALDGATDMTTIHMAPGATVISARTHGGLDRMTTGVSLLASLVASAIRALDTWREARIEAHNDAMSVELAAHDPRVLAELRAARDRVLG